MFKNILSYSSTLIWNSIPVDIRKANTIGDFVKKCLTWMKDLYFYISVHIPPPQNQFRWFTEPKCI